jgi:hypothetical protein
MIDQNKARERANRFKQPSQLRPPALRGYLKVMRDVRDIQQLPDGSPIPSSLKHALIVLAAYYPNVWPGQELLARDMSIHRRNVNRRLLALEDAGLIVRHRRGMDSTLYRLDLDLIRRCDGSVPRRCDGSVPGPVAVAPHEAQAITKTKGFQAPVSNHPEHMPEPVPVDDFESEPEPVVDWDTNVADMF